MGGGGSYYDRDTYRTAGTYSRKSEGEMSRSQMDKAMDPKDKSVSTDSESPLVLIFDVTGSMDYAPKVVMDKAPLIAGQLSIHGYLGKKPDLLIAAVGDANGDSAPFQIGDFVPVRSADGWFKRVWREGGGGGGARESYEGMAYFFANRCEMPKAKTPICIFFADEGYYEDLSSSDLKAHFGGQHDKTTAVKAFKGLRERFKDNVVLVHRRYNSEDADKWILEQWRSVLGTERVVLAEREDKAVADLILGVAAVMSGSRTIDEYCDDMKQRTNADTGKSEPQSPERIAFVRKALQPLMAIAPAKSRKPVKTDAETPAPKGKKAKAAPAADKTADDGKPARKRKPGRF